MNRNFPYAKQAGFNLDLLTDFRSIKRACCNVCLGLPNFMKRSYNQICPSCGVLQVSVFTDNKDEFAHTIQTTVRDAPEEGGE